MKSDKIFGALQLEEGVGAYLAEQVFLVLTQKPKLQKVPQKLI